MLAGSMLAGAPLAADGGAQVSYVFASAIAQLTAHVVTTHPVTMSATATAEVTGDFVGHLPQPIQGAILATATASGTFIGIEPQLIEGTITAIALAEITETKYFQTVSGQIVAQALDEVSPYVIAQARGENVASAEVTACMEVAGGFWRRQS